MTMKARLEELSGKRQAALAKASELLEAADKSDDGLTDDVAQQIDELTAKAEEIDGQISTLLEREKATKARLEKISGFADRSGEITNARGVHVPDASPSKPTAKIPATVKRYGSLTNFKGEVDGVSADERAYRFGQYALAKANLDLPNRYRFPKAMAFARDQFGFEQPHAVHGEGGSDTTGAHVFVPDEFGTDLIVLREMYGVARQLIRIVPMMSDTKTEPRRTGGLTAYFVGENATGTESDAGFDNVSLVAQKLMVLSRMSKELNEDSVINFGDTLAGEISYAFANKEDECVFNGDGTSTYGGITGARNRLATFTAGTDPGLIQGAGSTWASLTLPNFHSCIAALPQYADTPNARWICHKAFYHNVMEKLMLASGGVPAAEISNGVRTFRFLGYDVSFSQVFPGTTASGHIPVILGDLRLAGMLGDRRAESIEFSDTVTVGGQSVWERDQIAVKGTQRFDAVIHDFGSTSAAGPIVAIETQ